MLDLGAWARLVLEFPSIVGLVRGGETRSPWMGAQVPGFRPLPGDATADVVVIGAGITGATAALLLKQQGRKVMLLEARTVGAGETARSTAHVTVVPDLRFTRLGARFGRDN